MECWCVWLNMTVVLLRDRSVTILSSSFILLRQRLRSHRAETIARHLPLSLAANSSVTTFPQQRLRRGCAAVLRNLFIFSCICIFVNRLHTFKGVHFAIFGCNISRGSGRHVTAYLRHRRRHLHRRSKAPSCSDL